MTADDHPLYRDGLAALLAVHDDLELGAEAANGALAVALFREHRPDITLMDLSMPTMGGAKAIARIVGELPDARIIALTTYEGDADIHRALELTDREMEVLTLMAQGMSNKEIASAIGRAEATVKVHVLHILAKLDVDDRTKTATVALKRGMIHLDDSR